MSKFKVGDTGRRLNDLGLRFDEAHDKAGYTFVVAEITTGHVLDTEGFSHGLGAIERVSDKEVVEAAIAECETNLAKLKAQLADLVMPQVGDRYKDLTSSAVLTIEFIKGDRCAYSYPGCTLSSRALSIFQDRKLYEKLS